MVEELGVDVDDRLLSPALEIWVLLLRFMLQTLKKGVLHLHDGAQDQGEADLEHVGVLSHIR